MSTKSTLLHSAGLAEVFKKQEKDVERCWGEFVIQTTKEPMIVGEFPLEDDVEEEDDGPEESSESDDDEPTDIKIMALNRDAVPLLVAIFQYADWEENVENFENYVHHPDNSELTAWMNHFRENMFTEAVTNAICSLLDCIPESRRTLDMIKHLFDLPERGYLKFRVLESGAETRISVPSGEVLIQKALDMKQMNDLQMLVPDYNEPGYLGLKN